ncbi:hypothetical protein [Empedobacter falsenii]|uniref:Bacteriocin n=1 Tax=Empedobacter falsenii TaxID=343874 RepID=A0AAW7DJH4_9FLAO|nr:hypothetical protein [Empedobacter falsenii]MDM1551675.1 hypothetical protein [Empedobacter falsenii]
MKNLKKFQISKEKLKSLKGGEGENPCQPHQYYYCGACVNPADETEPCPWDE